ncbi:Chaperone J-domain superfamily [Arabidopsis thaliana x Arabidopsis arenosa]|uniref:Chaperone J-domain superfamily n=1 Tax=Arabidopsis thaliana x Arabidopsis arenosa TaxID=1240361 RepID=A0A8T2A5M9_9BRAS|nr:Chaperone J-domain superfamily [Arabidopsis thaliana x Arabidopsis arenosa]
MECNKEDAIRAREIAKRKFLANDFAGARKFALKAQFLYPELDGIAQMVATFDVHLSAQNIIYGEIDFYGVLGLNPEADHETVRKRYRKLAVMLHPDRNKSIGAEEAFKFLSQAWGVFSDKAKRADYDLKRNVGLYKGGGASSSRPATNGFQKVTKASGNTTKVKSSKRGIKRASDASTAATTSTSAQKTTADGTFWTVCRTCRTQYEYHRVYLNQNLLCPNCRKPFIAVETDPPGSGSIRKTFHEHQFDSLRHTTDGRKKNVSGRDNNGVYGECDSFEWGVFTGTKNSAHATQTGSRKDEVVRREYTKRVAGVLSTIPPKRRKVTENAVAGANIASCFAPKSTGVKEISEDELKNLLKKKAKSVISRNLPALCTIVAETETDANGRGMETEDLNGFNAGSSVNKNAIESCCMDSVEDTSVTDKDLNSLGALTLDVTAPDFCDFEKDRTEKSIRDDQIWAFYDSLEGMPRSYALIHNVISVDPFKVRMSWLTPVTNGELSSTNWLGFGIPKSCGGFRVWKTQICRSPYSFSHKVNLVKGSHGEFLIYPRRGDVWALYRKWSPDWNYLTGVEKVEYDIVEVVEGYTEEYGVSVVPLVKVAGFKAVFHHHLDPKETRRILRDEISRFSHMIPSYLLTGQEAPGAPRGCRQLDPAATPSQLLQAIDDYR